MLRKCPKCEKESFEEVAESGEWWMLCHECGFEEGIQNIENVFNHGISPLEPIVGSIEIGDLTDEELRVIKKRLLGSLIHGSPNSSITVFVNRDGKMYKCSGIRIDENCIPKISGVGSDFGIDDFQ